jgi:hypothetical protein
MGQGKMLTAATLPEVPCTHNAAAFQGDPYRPAPSRGPEVWQQKRLLSVRSVCAQAVVHACFG